MDEAEGIQRNSQSTEFGKSCPPFLTRTQSSTLSVASSSQAAKAAEVAYISKKPRATSSVTVPKNTTEKATLPRATSQAAKVTLPRPASMAIKATKHAFFNKTSTVKQLPLITKDAEVKVNKLSRASGQSTKVSISTKKADTKGAASREVLDTAQNVKVRIILSNIFLRSKSN